MSEPRAERRERGLWWDKAWTLVEGCTRCSAGCGDCWALGLEKRTGRAVEGGGIRLCPERLHVPLKRKTPTVYAIWNDLFHEDVPQTFRSNVLSAMLRAKQHRFLVLTKRARRMREFGEFYGGSLRRCGQHIMLGVTCESNDYLWRVNELVRTPAAVRFVNAHLFGPLDLTFYLPEENPGPEPYESEDEMRERIARRDATSVSGVLAECNRPFHGDPAQWWGWCESLVEQATAAGVPVWMKQGPRANGSVTHDLAEFPPWARRREFPQTREEGAEDE